ncbi:flagellar type III secretion system pore protein FliP [Brevundimonas faecalis]|uniref:Flagellar biosynthetic protein FliP n=1 Tax=Brevundimonas faecalis TaxID=947378 RepID=A0ABV2R7I8_9CAUL
MRRALLLGALIALAPCSHALAAPSTEVAAAVASVQTADVIRTTLALTLLAILPGVVICMTPFIRIVIVLSMIRHAFGMPETPPSAVLVSLSLLLTAFIMGPSLKTMNEQALQPFMAGRVDVETALAEGSAPLRTFMLRQVTDANLQTVHQIAGKPLPDSADQVGMAELTTAFMLHELGVAFRIGFVVLLPFLLIDLVVSGLLLSLGMMMVPPTSISLPIKVLMFVLIDGWSLVLEGVIGGFR